MTNNKAGASNGAMNANDDVGTFWRVNLNPAERLRGAIATISRDHWRDGAKPLRARLDSLLPQTEQDRLGVFCARVEFSSRSRIDLRSDDGTWSIAVLARGEQTLEAVDVAAFDPDERRAGVLLGKAFALGLDELCAAHLHPQFRVPVFPDIWKWLRNRGEGLLPLDWRRTCLHAVERRIGGFVAENVVDARLTESKMRKALTVPPVFVRQERVAA